jgi:hypothetical protein
MIMIIMTIRVMKAFASLTNDRADTTVVRVQLHQPTPAGSS